MKLNKFVIGLIVGLVAFASVGLTYNPLKRCEVDVRLVTLDGHDYVVAVTRNLEGGSGIGIVHHVGCRRCNNIISNER